MVEATRSFQDSAPKRDEALILWFEEVRSEDVGLVGGKNSSLGEMIQQLQSKGVNVPTGFATTAHAFRYFVKSAGLEAKLRDLFSDLDFFHENWDVISNWVLRSPIASFLQYSL